jgi:hypothetical protein
MTDRKLTLFHSPQTRSSAVLRAARSQTESRRAASDFHLYRGPGAGLAPPIGDPLRGPYLRWLVFYGSCFEHVIMDRYMKREAVPG